MGQDWIDGRKKQMGAGEHRDDNEKRHGRHRLRKELTSRTAA